MVKQKIERREHNINSLRVNVLPPNKKGRKGYWTGKKNPHITGKNHPNWTGGIRKVQGYIYIYSPNHPFKNIKNCVAEHRLVMEKHLGRYLKKGEVVHHINEIRTDNRIENLQLTNIKKHIQSHIKGDKHYNWKGGVEKNKEYKKEYYRKYDAIRNKTQRRKEQNKRSYERNKKKRMEEKNGKRRETN